MQVRSCRHGAEVRGAECLKLYLLLMNYVEALFVGLKHIVAGPKRRKRQYVEAFET